MRAAFGGEEGAIDWWIEYGTYKGGKQNIEELRLIHRHYPFILTFNYLATLSHSNQIINKKNRFHA